LPNFYQLLEYRYHYLLVLIFLDIHFEMIFFRVQSCQIQRMQMKSLLMQSTWRMEVWVVEHYHFFYQKMTIQSPIHIQLFIMLVCIICVIFLFLIKTCFIFVMFIELKIKQKNSWNLYQFLTHLFRSRERRNRKKKYSASLSDTITVASPGVKNRTGLGLTTA